MQQQDLQDFLVKMNDYERENLEGMYRNCKIDLEKYTQYLKGDGRDNARQQLRMIVEGLTRLVEINERDLSNTPKNKNLEEYK